MKFQKCIKIAIIAVLLSSYSFAGNLQSSKDPLEITYIKKDKAKLDRVYQEQLRKSDPWQKYIKVHDKWQVEFNEAAQKPHRAYGKPIQVNGQNPEAAAMNFIETHLQNWNLPLHDLKFQSTTESSKYFNVFYTQMFNGLEILNSRIFIKMTKDYRVNTWGTDIFDVSMSVSPSLDKTTAVTKGNYGITDKVEETSIPVLKILPVPDGHKVVFHLVYELTISTINGDKIPSIYYVLVDAATGEILYRQNRVRFVQPLDSDINVSSSVYEHNPFIPQVTKPLRNIKVSSLGNNYYTDSLGNISILGTNPFFATFYLQGLWSKVLTAGGSVTPSIIRSMSAGSNSITFDSVTTIRHTSGYFHVNEIHDFMKSYFPTFTGLDFPLPTRIDVTGGSCNAFYNGSSINFYEASGGCSCWSQVGDVVYHEYGHGINDIFYSSHGGSFNNGAMGEGYADVWALSLTKGPVLGYGTSISNASNYIRRYDIGRKVYPQNLVGEVHADGEIIAGAWYDVSLNFGSWPMMTSLFAETFYDLNTANDGQEGQLFTDILISALTADDDDADLSNGTPHVIEILDAFALHGIYLNSNVEIVHNPILSGTSLQPIVIEAKLVSPSQLILTNFELYYKNAIDSPYTVLPMTLDSGNSYSAVIPQQPIGSVVSYFLRVNEFGTRTIQSAPKGADLLYPNIPYFILIDFVRDKVEDFDFNQSSGWQTGIAGDSATGGAWIIAPPVASFKSGDTCQVGVQHTPGGSICAVTGNAISPSSPNYNSDVDNGKTTLQSPPIDVSTSLDPVITYWRWFTNDQGSNPFEDFWKTYVSGDGINFIKVEYAKVADHSWRRYAFKVSDYLPSATSVILRFVADDSSSSSVVEVALDDLEIYSKDLGTGVSPIAENSKMSLYPNPASSSLSIELELKHTEDISIDVINNLGQKVLTSQFKLSSGKNIRTLDIQKLENGIYYLVINQSDKRMERKFTVLR